MSFADTTVSSTLVRMPPSLSKQSTCISMLWMERERKKCDYFFTMLTAPQSCSSTLVSGHKAILVFMWPLCSCSLATLSSADNSLMGFNEWPSMNGLAGCHQSSTQILSSLALSLSSRLFSNNTCGRYTDSPHLRDDGLQAMMREASSSYL